jgi:CDP-glycerol glycerophosphotransferase
MKYGRRARPRVGVVVPVYDVEEYVDECLESLLAQEGVDVEVVVVDDGSTDGSAARVQRFVDAGRPVRLVRTENHGLGAARNEGARHVTAELLAFADSDDVVPPTAYAALAREVRRSGADFVTGSVVRWEGDTLWEPPWMRRLHRQRRVIDIDAEPEILGDVFAWNKLFKRDFWEGNALRWPEGVRYEDQPTTTDAYLRARRFGIVPDVVYHWRIRSEGTSITQQRSTLKDLEDRWATKRMALASVEAYGSAKVTKVFRDKVLAGDLHRYFVEIPGCDDEWWALLQRGVSELWGGRSLVHSGLPPVHRLTGWLVEQDRREDAAAVMQYVAALGGAPVPRVSDEQGPRIDVPVIDRRSVDRAALALRDYEW